MKIRLLISLLLLTLSTYTYCQLQVSGDVSGVWNVDTVLVVGDILVPEGEILEIYPGTKVLFEDHFTLSCNGTIVALGTEEEYITFSVSDTLGFSNRKDDAGGWGGIRILNQQPTADSSLFNFCKLSYAKGVGDSLDFITGAMLIDHASKVRISNTIFESNYAQSLGGAVSAYFSNILLSNDLFLNCTTGDTATSYAGALYAQFSKIKLQNSVVDSCTASSVGGAVTLFFCDSSVIENTIFSHSFGSTGGAIFLYKSNDVLISSSLFYNNIGGFFGGALGMQKCRAKVLNTTFSDNFSGQGGGAIYISSESILSFYNSILWGNTSGWTASQVYIAYFNSTANFYNSTVEYSFRDFDGSGGISGAYWGDYLQCAEDDPLFQNPDDANYALDWCSPSIDQGSMADSLVQLLPQKDLLGEARIVGGIVDQGCFESQSSSVTERVEKPIKYSVYPNPVEASVYILSETSAIYENIKLFSENGTLILQKNQCLSEPLDLSGLDAGVYLLTIGSSTTLKILKN